MVRQHSPDGSPETLTKIVREEPEGQIGVAYRQWMRDVLQPLNEKAASIIVEHVDLLDTSSIDPLLLQFVAHVFAYRVVLKRWEEGSINEWSALPYPDKLLEMVQREFKKIKRRQNELLGMKSVSKTGGPAPLDEAWDRNKVLKSKL